MEDNNDKENATRAKEGSFIIPNIFTLNIPEVATLLCLKVGINFYTHV